jgi:predicted adenylyl cyclase CyaB
MFEVEQKFKVKNPKAFLGRLKSLRAKRVSGGFEKNELWDVGRVIRKKRSILRLRHFNGKGLLTFKGPRLKGKFKKRVEIETPIDPKAFEKMLKRMGFKVVAHYEKTRENFKLGAVDITLDHLKKFGWFAEIEAPARSIEKIAAKLGFKKEDREDRSYLEMVYGKRSTWRGK